MHSGPRLTFYQIDGTASHVLGAMLRRFGSLAQKNFSVSEDVIATVSPSRGFAAAASRQGYGPIYGELPSCHSTQAYRAGLVGADA